MKKNILKPVDPGSFSDELLLDYYKKGWKDCANGNKEQKFQDQLLQRAYSIGWCDFIVGDDVSSVDMQTDEQILKHIRK
jgi:hypothetical protein